MNIGNLQNIMRTAAGSAIKNAMGEILSGDSALAQQTRAQRDYALPSPGSAAYGRLSPDQQAAVDAERRRRTEVAARQRREYIESVGGYGNYAGGFNDQDYWNAGAVSTDGAYYYGGEVYDGTVDPMNGMHLGAGYNGGSGLVGGSGGMFATGSGGTSGGTGYVAGEGGGSGGGSGGGNGTGQGGSNGCAAFERWDEASGQCVNVYDNPMGRTEMTSRSSGFMAGRRNAGMMQPDDAPMDN